MPDLTPAQVIAQAQHSRTVKDAAAAMLLRFATNKTRGQLGITRVQLEEMVKRAGYVGGLSSDMLEKLAAGMVTTPPPPPSPDPAGESLIIRPGVVFAAGSYIHTPLAANALVDPNSAAMVADFVRQATNPAFGYGHVTVNIEGGTPVLYIVGPDQPTVAIRWAKEGSNPANTLPQQWAAVPMPDNFVEPPETDREALIYQPSTNTLWEFWLMGKTGNQVVNSAGATVDGWAALWGGRMDNVSTNPGVWPRIDGIPYGTTASSLPFLGLMMTVAEMRQTPPRIEHALGIALMDTAPWDVYRAPALRSDGNGGGPIPMGACFRFPAAIDLASFGLDPFAYAIAKAIQGYGMYVWDRSGVVGFRAENPAGQYPEGDPWWKIGGILSCPAPSADSWMHCWPPHHFASGQGMPWHLLQVLKP